MKEDNQEMEQEDILKSLRYITRKNELLTQNAQQAGSIAVLADKLNLDATDPEAQANGYMAEDILNITCAIHVLADQIKINARHWKILDTAQNIDNATAENVKAVLDAEV